MHASLTEKWQLVDDLKRRASIEDYQVWIHLAVQRMMAQGVSMCATFVDVDPVVGEKALTAARIVRGELAEEFTLLLACQTLKGILDKNARHWIERALPYLDIIGGLPSKDSPYEVEHIDVLCELTKDTGLPLHVHIDQQNNPDESETEFLANKVIEHGLQGRVAAIHCISLAGQAPRYRARVLELMKDAGLSVICCPSAALSMRPPKTLSMTHNSIAPVQELLEAGITVGLGIDNINDVYMPFVDGDLWFEMRMLMEACRFYDMDSLVDIATTNGRRILQQ